MTNKDKLMLLMAVIELGEDEYGKNFERPATREEMTSLIMDIFHVSHQSSDEELNKCEEEMKDILTNIGKSLYEELKGELS